LHCDWHKLHPKLQQSIAAWLNAKASLVGERRVPGSETVVGISLDVYAVRKFGVANVASLVALDDLKSEVGGAVGGGGSIPHHRDTVALLVGDAAAGVPFFRALNLGFLCGSLAATCAANVLGGDCADAARAGGDDAVRAAVAAVVATYCLHASTITKDEIARARKKRMGLRIGGAWLEVSGAVPWQIVKFTKSFSQALSDPVAALPPAGTPEFAACVRSCSVCSQLFRTDVSSPRAR
jgi:hypothetical protein